MKSPLSVLTVLSTAFAAALVVMPADAQRSTRQRDIFATVVDGRDAPVPGLGTADFVVREDGVAREVIAVEPAPPPGPVALLIDNSQAAEPFVNDLRRAVGRFVEAIAASAQAPLIGMWTFGERPSKEADFTTADLVRLAVERLFARRGSGAYLLETILDAAAELRRTESTRGTIVAFVVEDGPEFSQTPRARIEAVLREGGITMWTIVLQGRASSQMSYEARERNQVLTDVAKASGGLTEVSLSRAGLDDAFSSIASLLASSYRITYGRPDALIPPETLNVSVRREGARVLAPKWAGQ